MDVTSRGDRRRADKALKAAYRVRTCWRCGFASVKEVPNSYLVISRDDLGNVAWSHASPTVCAGYVLAITNQARETVRGAFSDLVRIIGMRTREKLTGAYRLFRKFWEDDVDTVGGRASVENTRVTS